MRMNVHLFFTSSATKCKYAQHTNMNESYRMAVGGADVSSAYIK